MNLCRDYGKKLEKDKLKNLLSIAMKISDVMTVPELEEHLEELMEKSNVSEVNRRIEQDIVPKYKKFLMEDIVSSYKAISKEIRQFFEDTRDSQNEVLQTSMKSADEIRKSYEKSKKELDDVQAYREQLEMAMRQLKANTDERVEALCKSLQEMTNNA